MVKLVRDRPALWRSTHPLALGLGAALVVLLLLVTLPPATTAWTTSLRDRRSTQIQTFEELRSQIENDVQRMQAAQRGYLLTQQPTFLENYQGANRRLMADLEQLRALAPMVDPSLMAPVTDLGQHIERWRRDGPERQLELIRQNDVAAAVTEVSTLQSQQRFDAALAQLTLLAGEIGRINSALSARIDSVRQIETVLAIVLGALGLVLGVSLVRIFQNRARLADAIERERQRAEAAFVVAEQARGELQLQLDEAHRRNQQLRTLNRIASSAGVPLQVEGRAERLLQELTDLPGVDGGAVWWLQPADRQLELVSVRDYPDGAARPSISLDTPDALAAVVVANTPRVIEDTDLEAFTPGASTSLARDDRTRSLVMLPLHGRSGPIGALALTASTPHRFRSFDVDYFIALASQAGLMLENAELYEVMTREQQRLQVIFEQSPEGILFVEAGSCALLLANEAARMLMDDPLAAGQPTAPELLTRLYRANGEPFSPHDLPFLRALRGERCIGVEVVIEQRAGQRVPVLFNAVPLRDPRGNLGGAVAVFQNLSRFREVERLKSDFVAMVTHELRTPLTAIQGCTQTLLRGPNGLDALRQREFLEIIEAQSGRLHELIDNLLNLSQVEAGTLRLRKAPLQPGRLIRGVVRQASARLQDRTVQAEIPHALPPISADELRVEQILLNLVDNAHKFSPPDGAITIRAEARPDDLLVSVRDQGPGVPTAERERIFERFYQGTAAADGPPRGTGLGLAICRALVEAHGGRIWVDTQVDPGAQICFTLPRGMAQPTETAAPAPLASAIHSAHAGPHVLVVDDEQPLRQMLEGSLRNAGYVVGTVAEGQAALEYLASEQPDLIVLDLQLPGQDGFSVLQQVRDWSTVLVMILTASHEPENIVRGLQLGADDYLTKPFNMDEFLARLDALLRRRSAEIAPKASAILQSGPLMINWAQRRVEVNGQPVSLTPTEFRLLGFLAQHAGQVLSHEQILQHVWGPAYGGENQYLWVHVGRLRQKLGDDRKAPQMIVTERGAGYRFAGNG